MSTITPCLWFDRKAEEAARFYVSLLPDSRVDSVTPYSVEAPGGSPGDAMMVEFTLAGQSYVALNGGPGFPFSPAVSFLITCADQGEVDRLWDALSDGGTPQRCGWISDRYGVTWQVVPKALIEMMKDQDPVRRRRVTEAMMQMVKIDIVPLQQAYDGRTAA